MNEVISTVIELGLSLMNDINFYLVSPKINIGKMVVNVPMQFPYNPPKIQISTPGNNESRNMLKIGEINLLQKPRLSTIRWECFFPGDDYLPNIKKPLGIFLPPSVYVQALEMARDMREPLRLVVTGVGINQLVTVEEFDWWHENGTYEDKYYSIVFKEYREFSPKLVKESETKKSDNPLSVATTTPATAKDVITLDSVSKAAQEKAGSVLGSPAANTIALNPKAIAIGAVGNIVGKVTSAVSTTQDTISSIGSTVKEQKAKIISLDNKANSVIADVNGTLLSTKKGGISI